MDDAIPWWWSGTIYHIYPRSFMDTDGDGIGDLPGIIARLDYLGWLGVDAIWLSPFYPSPMADFGYDISDHCAIDPRFGTLADFDALVAEAHRRRLRVIVDFVPNHTSDQHPWFAASRSSRLDPKRRWYLWADPAPDGGPPNNWLSVFGGSAWTWDAATRQYYYHAFLREQPDLNWREPAVQVAMLDVLHFWLDRGVDGFRIDALRQLIEDEHLRDNPPNPAYRPDQSPYCRLLALHSADRPEVHEMITRMRQVVDRRGVRLLIGELYLPIERLVAYYGVDGGGVHLPTNFHLIRTPWQAERIAALIDAYEAALPPHGWPNWTLGNHDRDRVASRIGRAQARVAAMLLLTLRGTPTLYYGDELGMENVPIAPEQVQDPIERNMPGLGLGRDPERSPMQWDGGPNAGFTTGDPWLPIAADSAAINVSTERRDPTSVLTLHRRLLALRRGTPALTSGSHRSWGARGDVLAYERALGDERILVALNLGPRPQRFEPRHEEIRGRVVLSTHLDRESERVVGTVDLRPDEGVVLRLEGGGVTASEG